MKKYDSDSKNLIGGTFLATLSILIVKIIGVIYKVPLSYILDEEGMGYFNSAYTVFGFFYILCSAGVPKAMSIILSKDRLKKTATDTAIYKTALHFFVLLGIVITCTLLLLSAPIAKFIGAENAKYALLTITPSLLFLSPSAVMRGYLNAKVKLQYIAAANLIEALSKLGVGLLLSIYAKQRNIPIPILSALAIVGITVGSMLSLFYMWLKIKPTLSKEKAKQSKQNRKNILKELKNIALPITVTTSVLSITNIFDLGIIMRRLKDMGYSEISASKIYGNYTTLVIPMLNTVVAIVSQITLSTLPKLVNQHTKGDIKSYNKTFLDTLRFISFLTAPCAALFMFYSFDILDILFTPQMSANGFEMLSAISLSMLLLPILTTLNTALESRRKFLYSFISLMIGTTAKLLLNILLISNEAFGTLGAPFATVISYFLSTISSYILLKKDKLKVKYLHIPIIYFFISLISCAIPYLTIYGVGTIKNYCLRFAFSVTMSIMLYLSLCLITLKNAKKTNKY